MKDLPDSQLSPSSGENHSRYRIRIFGRLIVTILIFIYILNGCSRRITKIYHIGILSGMDSFLEISDSFINKMTGLGYIEGKNVVYDYWKSNDNEAMEEKIIRLMIENRVDLILTFPSRSALTAKALTRGTGIPVVFAGASIEGTNLVNSQREPGGNITGVRFPTPELNAKRFELLLTLAPKVKRILLFYDVNYPSYISARKAINSISVQNSITLIECPVSTLDEIIACLREQDSLPDIGVDAIFLMPDLVTSSETAWDIIRPFVIKHKLPVVSTKELNFLDDGLIMLNSSHKEIGELAAVIADKILHGTPAGTIPVASPNINIYINYRRAQKLGLTIPEGLIRMATEVIY